MHQARDWRTSTGHQLQTLFQVLDMYFLLQVLRKSHEIGATVKEEVPQCAGGGAEGQTAQSGPEPA